MQHYKLTNNSTVNSLGFTVYQIVATIDSMFAKKGELGGWVESEYVRGGELRIQGNAWIDGNAQLFSNAKIMDNVFISGNSRILDNVIISGNVQVLGSLLYGDIKVSDNVEVVNSEIHDTAKIYGNAKILNQSEISGNAQVFDFAEVHGKTHIGGDAKIFGKAKVYDASVVSGKAQVFGFAEVYGKTHIYGNAKLSGNTKVYDGSKVYGDALIVENAKIFDNSEVFGCSFVKGNAKILCNSSVDSINVEENSIITGYAYIEYSEYDTISGNDIIVGHEFDEEIVELFDNRQALYGIIKDVGINEYMKCYLDTPCILGEITISEARLMYYSANAVMKINNEYFVLYNLSELVYLGFKLDCLNIVLHIKEGEDMVHVCLYGNWIKEKAEYTLDMQKNYEVPEGIKILFGDFFMFFPPSSVRYYG